MSRANGMKLRPLEMEPWQSTWEHAVECNLSESGVEPLPLRELLRDEAGIDRFLGYSLAYSQGDGTPELRSSIPTLYSGATPDHVLVNQRVGRGIPPGPLASGRARRPGPPPVVE